MPDLSALAGLMGGGGGRSQPVDRGGGGGGGSGIPSFSGFEDNSSVSGSSSPSPASSSSSTGRGGGAPADMMERLKNSPHMAEMQRDPEFQAVAQMIQGGDYAGAMRLAQSNPSLMQKIMGAMSNIR